MAYLGDVPVDASITVRVIWTPDAGSPPITASALTFVHEDGTQIVGPLPGDDEGNNTFAVHTAIPRSGRWRIRWVTTPPGGATNDVLYAD